MKLFIQLRRKDRFRKAVLKSCSYKMVVHCGGCMLNEREMKYRIACCQDQGVPITNYGILIAQVTGILKRSLGPFPEMQKLI